MENHHAYSFSIGKPSINGPFSVAMLNNRRVYKTATIKRCTCQEMDGNQTSDLRSRDFTRQSRRVCPTKLSRVVSQMNTVQKPVIMLAEEGDSQFMDDDNPQLIQQRVYNPEKNHQPTIIYQSTSSFMISYVEWLKRLKSLFSVNRNISHDLWFLGSVTVRSLSFAQICWSNHVKCQVLSWLPASIRCCCSARASDHAAWGSRGSGYGMLWVKTLVP